MDKDFGHFTFKELTRSDWAEAHNVPNIPNQEQIENIKMLCEKVLNPLREHFGVPIFINSCFRSSQVNAGIGSKSKGSQHLANNGAAAADIHVKDIPMRTVYDWIKNNLEFDQLIDESDLSWIHVSYSKIKNRKQSFKL